jgi:hypothetical protein
VLLDEPLEQPVAEQEDLLTAVQRLAQREELDIRAQRGDQPVGGRVE